MDYFSADLHFSHARVLEFCKNTRKFNSIEDHDKELIAAHNRVVGPNDDWWCLGDFSFSHDHSQVRRMFYALNGRSKHLIVGNHDKQPTLQLPWDSIQHYKELNHEKHKVVLFHYPIKEGQWNGAHRGSILLFGHVHGASQYMMPVRAMDVGVDSIGFSPISMDAVFKKMSKINNFVPHHKS